MKKNINFSEVLGTPPLPSDSMDANDALLWARGIMQRHLSIVNGVQDPKGIDELKCVKLGGVDQWMHIRGRNRENPILLFLHGGPGTPIIGSMDAIQRPWEDYFTVVKWDQRQTGKSYYPANDDVSPLTVQQFIEDTQEFAQHLLEYLKKEKLFVMGNSWGTVLGIHLVKNRPDWIHAYIGVGQVVNTMANERALYRRALCRAMEKNEFELAAKIEGLISCLDYGFPEREESWVENSTFVRRELSRLAGETLAHNILWDDVTSIVDFENFTSPHLTLADIENLFDGDKPALFRSPYTFTKEFLDVDLPSNVGSSFEVPIFFFSGSHDWQTPVTLSDEWFEKIDAPYKELIHFSESSHIPMAEEPGKVFFAMVNKVLPFSEIDIDGK